MPARADGQRRFMLAAGLVPHRNGSRGTYAPEVGSQRTSRILTCRSPYCQLLSHGFFLPQHAAEQLSRGRTREFFYDHDFPGQLVGCNLALAEGDQLFAADGLARLQHDEGFGNLAAHLVWYSDDSDIGNSRMGGQGDLNLLRSNAVTRTFDDVVLPRHEPEVAILIGRYEVTGSIPALGSNGMALFVGIAPIDRASGSTSHKVTDHTGLGFLILLVDNLQLVARYGLAEGARLGLATDHVGGENVHHLSRAQPLEDLLAEFLLPRIIGRGGQALATAGTDAQAAEIIFLLRVRHLQHLAVGRGGQSQDRDVMFLYGVKHLLRFELGDERGSRSETERDGRVAGVARPKSQRGGATDNVVLRDLPPVLPETVGHDKQFLDKVDGSFGSPRCARRVQEQTHVFAFAEHRIEGRRPGLQQLAIGEEALGLHLGSIAPHDNNVLDGLETIARCLHFAQERSTDDDCYRLRVVRDVSDLGAREQGRRRSANRSQLEDREVGDQGRRYVRRAQNDAVAFLHSQATQRAGELVGLSEQLIVRQPLVFKEHGGTLTPTSSDGLAEQFFCGVEPFSIGRKLRHGINTFRPQLAWW